MFGALAVVPADPILGVLARFREDPRPDKIDVSVGVYRDETGRTPVMAAVKRAEARLLAEQATKAYGPAAGDRAFNQGIERLVLGDDHPVVSTGRTRVIQMPGGCGALRLGAELIRTAHDGSTVYVSDPTWGNHRPLLAGAGIKVRLYPYRDPQSGRLRFDEFLHCLQRLPPSSVVLLQASCHNPTGVDLADEQWRRVADTLEERQLLPFIDMAYQGLGQDLALDAFGPRLLATRLPEMLVAVSCSKNFGLYRERVGALLIVARDVRGVDAAESHVLRSARSMYSMAPDHGAAVVGMILGDDELRAAWSAELGAMAHRIRTVRSALASALVARTSNRDFASVARDRGMFSLLPLSHRAIGALQERYGVYLVSDGRINVAGLTLESIPRFAAAIAEVISE